MRPLAHGRIGFFDSLNDTINAAETELSSLHLRLGQTFEYLFDYGDMWWHVLKVVRIDPINPSAQLPMVAERHGESPQQYPPADE